MGERSRPYGYLTAGNRLISGLLVFIFWSLTPGQVLSDPLPSLEECAKIENDAERLKCYDQLSGRRPAESPPEKGLGERQKTREEKAEKASYFSRVWELERETRRSDYAITPYRSNYILPFTYNDSPNFDAVREADPQKDLKNAEVNFQLSLKVKLWQDILGKKMDLWFGYTQRSFWQFYNFEDSSPFRETNYEPELLLNFRTDYRLLGFKGRFIHLGFNHQSNGQAEPLSRSWNRVVAGVGFERDNLSILLKGWYRVPEDPKKDDNPNIEDYLGYGEIWAYYFWKENRFGVMLRNNLKIPTNRGALQLEWSFPLIPRVSGYVQYFVGYGESLLDYNHSVNRIGIGLILTDWD